MRLIDRYIFVRFFVNFTILFMLLFLFAISVDLLLSLDRFVEMGRELTGDDASFFASTIRTFGLVLEFQTPRIFMFYSYMHGLIAIGAMAFTVAQMHRHKELVALLASGVSLYRVAMPFLVCAFMLSIVQLVNQETMLPKVAPLLLRDHGQIGSATLDSFAVPLTPDSAGNVVQAQLFRPDPVNPVLEYPTILEVDERGRTTRRISARSATWKANANAWTLHDGVSVRTADPNSMLGAEPIREPIAVYETDLSPRALTMRRHSEYAAMLSLRQIEEMLSTPSVVDVGLLTRHKYARFAVVLVNLLVMALTLPSFLLRGPASLLRQSLFAAGIAVPAMMGAGLGMNIDMPGISPAVGVFLPVIILLLLTLARWTYFRS